MAPLLLPNLMDGFATQTLMDGGAAGQVVSERP